MKDEELILDAHVEEVLRYGVFSIAHVVLGKIIGRGISRKSYLDKFDIKKAESIAIGRAKKALIKKIKGETIHEAFMG